MSKMKRVTKNNLIKYVEMKKEYLKDNSNKELLKQINDFTDNVINKDSRYYHKLTEYKFDRETLKYLM